MCYYDARIHEHQEGYMMNMNSEACNLDSEEWLLYMALAYSSL